MMTRSRQPRATPSSRIDDSIDIESLNRKFGLLNFSDIVDGNNPWDFPEKTLRWLPERVKHRIPGVNYSNIEDPSAVTRILLDQHLDRFTDMKLALVSKASKRGENSTHVQALQRAYPRPSLYPCDMTSDYHWRNMLQVGGMFGCCCYCCRNLCLDSRFNNGLLNIVNEGSNQTHQTKERDDYHYVFLYDVRQSSQQLRVTNEAIEGEQWIRLMVLECKSKFTISDINKAIEQGIARCSNIRHRLRFRQEVTGTYFEPAVPVVIFAGNQFLSMTIVPMPCVLAVLLGLTNPARLNTLTSERGRKKSAVELQEKEVEVLQERVKSAEERVKRLQERVKRLEKDVELQELRIATGKHQKGSSDGTDYEAKMKQANEEMKQATKDLKKTKEKLKRAEMDLKNVYSELQKGHEELKRREGEMAKLGPYPSMMWVTRNRFLNCTTAEGTEDTKKVHVYTGEEGIVSIGQMIQLSGILAKEILDYLGVGYRVSGDKVLDEHVPPLFQTMSMKFSLPSGSFSSSKRIQVYIWDELAAIKHFAESDHYEREVQNYKKLNSCSMRKPDLITKDDRAHIVMYSFCGWTLLEALQKEIVPNSSAVVMLFFSKVLYQVSLLHEANLVHLDLKLPNILVNKDDKEDFSVTLIDYEFIKKVGDKVSGVRGSPGFIPPELESNKSVTEVSTKMDMYSLAKTFLFTSAETFDRESTFDSKAMSIDEWVDRSHGGWCDWVNDSLKSYLQQMLSACLNPNPEQRWDVSIAMQKLEEVLE